MPITKARFRISDYNEQRKKSVRDKEGKIRMVSLSLTSMVDMFAILVIFLLTSSGTVTQWLELGHGIELPKAKSGTPSQRGITLEISKRGLYVQKKPFLSVSKIMASPGPDAMLQEWLKRQPKENTYVNVVADKSLPFGVVKRVVLASQDAGFAAVNLAIQPTENKP